VAKQGFWDETLVAEDSGPVIVRRPVRDTADLDITPMIDMVFLLLIFFLVASTPDLQTAVELPPARYGKGVSQQESVIITVAERGGPGPALVYLADGKVGAPLPDQPELQRQLIVQAVQRGFEEGKPNVLVKAERGVLHREVARVAAAAGEVDKIHLYLAVFEVD
jgi:biopolymer transport protein ExbD